MALRRAAFSSNELSLLQILEKRKIDLEGGEVTDITELASLSGINSRDEVQRALYILEGRDLVQPEPSGDLTSSRWRITETGTRALDTLTA